MLGKTFAQAWPGTSNGPHSQRASGGDPLGDVEANMDVDQRLGVEVENEPGQRSEGHQERRESAKGRSPGIPWYVGGNWNKLAGLEPRQGIAQPGQGVFLPDGMVGVDHTQSTPDPDQTPLGTEDRRAGRGREAHMAPIRQRGGRGRWGGGRTHLAP